MESETDNAVPGTVEKHSPEHMTLYRDIYEAVIQAVGKHPSFGATDALIIMGNIAGAIIGSGYPETGLIRSVVIRNMDIAIEGNRWIGMEPAGNA